MLTNQQEDNDYEVIAEGSSTIAEGNNSNLKSFFNNKLYYINKHLNVLIF